MGWTGEAAAASLTMDLGQHERLLRHKTHQSTYQTSCLCPATRAAGLKGSSRRVVADIARLVVKMEGLLRNIGDVFERSNSRVGVNCELVGTAILISTRRETV